MSLAPLLSNAKDLLLALGLIVVMELVIQVTPCCKSLDHEFEPFSATTFQLLAQHQRHPHQEDFLFVGSSITQLGVHTATFVPKYKVFNLGLGGGLLDLQYWALKHYLTHYPKPRHVVLEAFPINWADNTNRSLHRDALRICLVLALHDRRMIVPMMLSPKISWSAKLNLLAQYASPLYRHGNKLGLVVKSPQAPYQLRLNYLHYLKYPTATTQLQGPIIVHTIDSVKDQQFLAEDYQFKCQARKTMSYYETQQNLAPILNLLAHHQINVTFVKWPMTAACLTTLKTAPGWMTYESEVARVSQQYPMIQLPDSLSNRYFWDYYHLNQAGSQAMSKTLVQQLSPP